MIEKNTGAKIIWLILEISNLLNKYGEYICQENGITTQQWLIMLYLAGDPNIPYFEREKHFKPLMASELADAFNVSRPNITNLILPLIKQKFVVQQPDEVDRRKKRLKLTDKGEQLLQKLEPGRKAFNEQLLEKFSPPQRKQLLKYLENCNDTILAHFTSVLAE